MSKNCRFQRAEIAGFRFIKLGNTRYLAEMPQRRAFGEYGMKIAFI